MRDSFVIHRPIHETIKAMPKRYRYELYEAVAEYLLDGTEPTEMSGSGMAAWWIVKYFLNQGIYKQPK